MAPDLSANLYKFDANLVTVCFQIVCWVISDVYATDPHYGGKVMVFCTCDIKKCNSLHFVKFTDKVARMLGFDMYRPNKEFIHLNLPKIMQGHIAYHPNTDRNASP
ncbi:hypothetical protein EAI_07012 [Harpegnathos saltator]|uniref:Uncharacterized protein n=1 Tax=Harpegnathos saltator TaxID=610380 RepID=E2BRW5_HARSA|nr:hypothetical protein EAI_07012 [Harpegnathos saltator]